MTSSALTRVMLVDDHSIMRDLLRDALENTGEFQVAAQAADGGSGLRNGPRIRASGPSLGGRYGGEMLESLNRSRGSHLLRKPPPASSG